MTHLGYGPAQALITPLRMSAMAVFDLRDVVDLIRSLDDKGSAVEARA